MYTCQHSEIKVSGQGVKSEQPPGVSQPPVLFHHHCAAAPQAYCPTHAPCARGHAQPHTHQRLPHAKVKSEHTRGCRSKHKGACLTPQLPKSASGHCHFVAPFVHSSTGNTLSLHKQQGPSWAVSNSCVAAAAAHTVTHSHTVHGGMGLTDPDCNTLDQAILSEKTGLGWAHVETHTKHSTGVTYVEGNTKADRPVSCEAGIAAAQAPRKQSGSANAAAQTLIFHQIRFTAIHELHSLIAAPVPPHMPKKQRSWGLTGL
jgi:hypothetical protein